jgi:hypothetical protein
MSDIVLDLPVPPSVNRSRRLDRAELKKSLAWQSAADSYALSQKVCRRKIAGRYEAIIVLDPEHAAGDLDNRIKALLDYAVRINLVADDSKKYLQRLTVEWGTAPFGCRLTLRAITA